MPPTSTADERDAQTSVPVETKTSPNVREHADDSTFAKNYLVSVDDSSVELPVELIERQFYDMRQTAFQRGLVPQSLPRLLSTDVKDKHNVLLTYVVDVIDNAPGEKVVEAVEPGQSATGEKLRKGDNDARTADGKTVRTTSPETVVEAGEAEVEPKASGSATQTVVTNSAG